MARVLVVEDDTDLREVLEHTLRREGFHVVGAGLGADALTRIRREPPDLVLLDRMLPDLPGTEVCRKLKGDPATARIPVLVLTALADVADRISGFEAGADDYLSKPCSLRELVLRVRALLRAVPSRPSAATYVQAGPITLDLPALRATVGGREIRATALEFQLLALLVSRPGRVLTRAEILAEAGRGLEVSERAIDTHVKRLRTKLGPAAAWLETVRGVGYRFRDPGATASAAGGGA
jgi:two-component system phosphate regulon response regulator PhoB